jgi:hypothetical protein
MAIGDLKKRPGKEESKHAQDEAPVFERVEWKKEPGLRKLYFYAIILCVASATTGYDGYVARKNRKVIEKLTPNRSFFNAVQNFDSWLEFFDHPDGSILGLLGALYQIGSLVSIPLV